jgi:hypothetical protein
VAVSAGPVLRPGIPLSLFHLAGSDWIPEDAAISSLTSKRGLVIRYPIRMKEDLLPVHMLSFEKTARILEHVLHGTGCGMDPAQIADLAERQLRLPGTVTLHSKTAERNGGDCDFDLVAVLQDSEFPRFVESRFDMREGYQKKKDKRTRRLRSNLHGGTWGRFTIRMNS